jgi:hypothetical protein
MNETLENQVKPQYESADELTGKEIYDLAKLAVEGLTTEMKESEKFPGDAAYNKVMRVVVEAAGTEESNKVHEQWQEDYEKLEAEYKTVEDPQVFVEKVRVKLQEALDSVQKAIEAAVEKVIDESVEDAIEEIPGV